MESRLYLDKKIQRNTFTLSRVYRKQKKNRDRPVAYFFFYRHAKLITGNFFVLSSSVFPRFPRVFSASRLVRESEEVEKMRTQRWTPSGGIIRMRVSDGCESRRRSASRLFPSRIYIRPRFALFLTSEIYILPPRPTTTFTVD